MNYSVEKLKPFGAIIRNTGESNSIDIFSAEQMHQWVSEFKVVVFRGYQTMSKQTLALYGQTLGKPLQWAFGAINELKVKPDAENYIFTDHEVPLHWDGAFAGKIPHIILFQCLTAPKKEDMGGTTFCDTSLIVASVDEKKIAQWKNISITYTTKKIVHYGGKIIQPLLQKHEVENKQVMRYAEPVDDLNPVTLSIQGLQDQTPDSFINEMKLLLYNPKNMYTHRWENNDIVLADNHTLLHGREAFKNPNERFIQRINILQRPAYFSIWRYLENCLTIRRKEFFVAELPIFLIPLLLNINNQHQFLNPLLYLGLLAIILLFNIGDMINCYADYELDSIYKSYLSNAVYELGKKNVKLQIILSGVVALIITAFISFYTKQYYLLPLTIIGTIIGLQYSVRPFKFKSRGLWQLLCLWGIIFFGPMLYTAIITQGFPSWLQLLIFSLYGFHQMGIILLNTAEDYTEDKASGLRTIIIFLGLHRAMNFAYYLVMLTGIGLQLCVYYLFQENVMPWYTSISILVFTAGWFFILFEYKKIISKINSLHETEAIKEIKKNGMKVPRWLKIGAYTFLFPILIYFLWFLFNQ
jgi:alpha-ketoglutarate-dependent taurine dioxygenase/4-hydroxybenzoate polyprenyltransferase